jgi:hypothetical protein
MRPSPKGPKARCTCVCWLLLLAKELSSFGRTGGVVVRRSLPLVIAMALLFASSSLKPHYRPLRAAIGDRDIARALIRIRTAHETARGDSGIEVNARRQNPGPNGRQRRRGDSTCFVHACCMYCTVPYCAPIRIVPPSCEVCMYIRGSQSCRGMQEHLPDRQNTHTTHRTHRRLWPHTPSTGTSIITSRPMLVTDANGYGAPLGVSPPLFAYPGRLAFFAVPPQEDHHIITTITTITIIIDVVAVRNWHHGETGQAPEYGVV